MRNFGDKLKRYFPFSRKELNGFLLTTLVFAFVFSFNEWGVEQFDFVLGIKNLFIALIIVGVSLFVHHAAQRVFAIAHDIRAEQRVWWPGLLICLALALLSNGKLFFFAASAVWVHMVPSLRIGRKPYAITLAEHGKIALAGPAANVILGAIVGLLGTGPLASQFFTFNILFAAFNLLPIPPLDGAIVFFASRLTYVFALGAIVGFTLLVLLMQIHSIFLALLIGAVFWLIFYIMFERGR